MFREQAKLFQENMAKLFGEDGDPAAAETVALGFQKMAEAAGIALGNDKEQPNSMDPEFSDSIQEVLKGLNAGQEAAQNPFNPEELAGIFQNLDFGSEEGAGGFMPFMQNMMQNLLSAEILLPSLKDLVEKYPKWIEENSSKLTQTDKEKYEKQLVLMKDVCSELEKEKPSDSSDIRKERFNNVLEKMQKMQDLGQPPPELLGDGGATTLPGFDPTATDQCSIM